MTLHPDHARLAVYVLGVVVVLLVETAWPRRLWRASRLRRLSLHAGLLAAGQVLVWLLAATPLALLAAWVSREHWGFAGVVGLRGWPEIVASVVVLDAADYGWHRASHRVGFLWRFHRVHHADTHLDVTTALRFHPGELLLSAGVKAAWILVWGPSAWGFAVFQILTSIAAQFHHGNYDLGDRLEPAVRLVTVTPRMHASHHSARTETLHANFSTLFTAWDRLFGSYVEPTTEHLREQGLSFGRDRDLDLAYVLGLPFRRVPPR